MERELQGPAHGRRMADSKTRNMKFIVAFAALVAVSVASPVFKPSANLPAHLQAIAAAIQNPSTNPTTAQLLQNLLDHIAAAGPAIVPEPIHIGPEIVDFPVPAEPVIVGDIPEGSPAPLVQIIVNVNHGGAPPVGPVFPDKPVDPVIVVDNEPVHVDPVIVVDNLPVPVEPVDVVVPVLPDPAINLPEELN
ncbi:uncharacterized protein LOC142979735 isoform X1 [Anticarsia gemmatalis]|uniref:uncharacterized protein LOC142979735 isoform X1 n=2 Tax=Anticarsia gemmatalis TaxID=129554 RepID=UPI003F772F77